ncbi:MarR family winged helix-turn-helix transcriptional regulator [Fictibacillus iocasae]|uniref:MarR family winged helix-turn-helix transcriptional regulator n=1 Tax=Fictibacillus iocasae TaxID=2715437 RepID=A0ABW2NMV0_9BACL
MAGLHILIEKLLQDYQKLLKEELKKSGRELTPVQYKILYEVFFHEGLSIKECAARLATDLTTFSRQVQSLEKSGLMKRQTNKSDKRIVQLYLTANGTDTVDRMTVNINDRLIEKLSDLNDFEEETIVRSIAHLSKKMRVT